MAQPTGQSKTDKLEPAARMKQLIEMSHSIVVDRNVPVDRYLQSGRELIKAAAAFNDRGEVERAFVLYLRYMTLFVEKLPHHPDYNKSDKNEIKLVKEECIRVFDLAEALKKRILEKYECEYKEAKEVARLGTAGTISVESITTKRSIELQGRPPIDCDMDEIDRKFNFSELNFAGREPSADTKPFDPFNIEELKLTFGTNSDDH